MLECVFEHIFAQDYISELYYNFVQYDPNFVKKFIIATFDDNSGQVLTSTIDAHTLFEFVWHINTTASTQCIKKVVIAMRRALSKLSTISSH